MSLGLIVSRAMQEQRNRTRLAPRERVEASQCPETAVYLVNPQVAWNGDLHARKEKTAVVGLPRPEVMEDDRP